MFGQALVRAAAPRFKPIAGWKSLGDDILDMFANSDLNSIGDALMNAVSPIRVGFFWVIIAMCLCAAFFGRKIMPVVKFFVFLFLGFCAGVHFVASALPPQINIPPWVIGLVIALLSAVLSKFIYVALYFVLFSYGTYSLLVYLFFFNSKVTATGEVVCIIISIIILILAFIFRKFVEMAATSVLGSLSASLLLNNQIYDFATWPLFGGTEWIGIFILTLLLTALSFFVQIITRRRY